ncbi:hypothetical protein OPQ81_000086 [Rhizoctonia solani]|nr:hypothetical protein OPQ81_000086 [Rhizoctonia solani]
MDISLSRYNSCSPTAVSTHAPFVSDKKDSPRTLRHLPPPYQPREERIRLRQPVTWRTLHPQEQKGQQQEGKLPPASEAVTQAGGGVSGTDHARRIATVSAVVLPYLEKVFNCHADTNQAWHRNQAETFIRCTQAGNPDSTAEGLPAELAAKDELDFNDFLRYMTSDAASALAPLEPQTGGDLSYPLSSYFISSSHNTYLTGNQLSSDASTDAYKNVLLRGCRCIEIDVWDGDDSDSEDSGYSSSDLEEQDPKKAAAARAKRKAKVDKAKAKIPKSVLHKLEKTSLGKKLENQASSSPASSPLVEKLPAAAAAIIEPRVLHGYTLTKEISFREVCVAIKDYAFAVTDLPLIVSLEVHAGPEQQEIMVKIMNETWADFLIDPPEKEADILPSPTDLRRKILVKVKYAPPGQEAAAAAASDEDLSTPGQDAAPGSPEAKKKKKPSKIIHPLSALGIYTKAVSFKSLHQPEATMPSHVFSLGEKTVREVHEKQGQDLFEHNRKYLMRAYPSGFRVGSSNIDPTPFWRKGIQIAALNWQNWDEGMMLNEGMFAGSGGYVLKPLGYRQDKPDAPSEPAHVQHRTLDLEIKVFAAQNLPLPPETSVKSFNPYIKVELHVEAGGERHGHFAADGHECDPATAAAAKAAAIRRSEDDEEIEGEYKARTKTAKATCDPDYKGEILDFKAIPGVVEELSFVRFIVRDDIKFRRDDLAAWASIRLDRLRMGYRFVRLMDAKGQESDGFILIKVMKKVY